jgi:CheY-like chemotaxis protein
MSAYVLVVEDNDDIRESVVELLRGEGFRVREARDGCEALDELHEIGDNACLVLTDWQMPGMCGADLLKEMNARQTLATLPVIVSTASDLAHPERRVIRKPVSAETLLRLVGEYCTVCNLP